MDVAAFDSLIPYPKDGKDGIGERGPLPYPLEFSSLMFHIRPQKIRHRLFIIKLERLFM